MSSHSYQWFYLPSNHWECELYCTKLNATQLMSAECLHLTLNDTSLPHSFQKDIYMFPIFISVKRAMWKGMSSVHFMPSHVFFHFQLIFLHEKKKIAMNKKLLDVLKKVTNLTAYLNLLQLARHWLHRKELWFYYMYCVHCNYFKQIGRVFHNFTTNIKLT